MKHNKINLIYIINNTTNKMSDKSVLELIKCIDDRDNICIDDRDNICIDDRDNICIDDRDNICIDDRDNTCIECGYQSMEYGLDCIVNNDVIYCGYNSNRDTAQYKFKKGKYKENDAICDECMNKMVRKKSIKRLYTTEYDMCYECDKEIDIIDKAYFITKGKLYIDLHNYKNVSNLKNTSDDYSLCQNCFSDKIIKS